MDEHVGLTGGCGTRTALDLDQSGRVHIALPSVDFLDCSLAYQVRLAPDMWSSPVHLASTNAFLISMPSLEDGGGLSEFSVIDDELGAPGVIECIQGKATSVEFPKVDVKTPCVQLVHPMKFP